jgi:hypothetical protein
MMSSFNCSYNAKVLSEIELVHEAVLRLSNQEQPINNSLPDRTINTSIHTPEMEVHFIVSVFMHSYFSLSPLGLPAFSKHYKLVCYPLYMT